MRYNERVSFNLGHVTAFRMNSVGGDLKVFLNTASNFELQGEDAKLVYKDLKSREWTHRIVKNEGRSIWIDTLEIDALITEGEEIKVVMCGRTEFNVDTKKEHKRLAKALDERKPSWM